MRRQLVLIATLTLLSQLAAFAKLWVTARTFGVGAIVDGYNLALVVPVLISSSVSGIVQTGLFPIRSRIAAQQDGMNVDAFERSILIGVLLLGVVLSIALAAITTSVTSWVAGDASLETQQAFNLAFPPLISLLALNVVGDCTGYILAMRNRFDIAAGAPIANGIVGVLILFLYQDGGVSALVWSTVVGVAVQVGIGLFGLRMVKLNVIGAMVPMSSLVPAIVDMARLGVWMLPGVILSNLVLSLPQIWITSFGAGAVSAFGYALRLHLAVVQLIVMASSTVILAKLADLVSTGQTDQVDRVMRAATHASWAIGTIGILGVWLLGDATLNLMLDGKFTPEAASRVTLHWLIITLSLPCTILGNIYAKLWQAQGKPFLMTLLSAVNLGVMFLTFMLVSTNFLEYSGAVALTAGATMTALLAVVIEWFRRNHAKSQRVM